MSRRFHHWAYLTEEGREIYGDIFPNGQVPVISMIPGGMQLQDPKTGASFLEKCFKVYLPELEPEQLDKIIDLVHSRHPKISRETIRKEIEKIGLPLRARYTSGSGTDHPGLFI